MKIVQQTLPNLWAASDTGTHVALPLDVSAVSDAVVEKVAQAICNAFADDGEYHPSWSHASDDIRSEYRVEARAAIAALAAALGEEG